jgi:hypothetical protein
VSFLAESNKVEKQVALLIQNDAGFITHRNAQQLGDGTPSDAEMFADMRGFDTDGEWFPGNSEGVSFCYLKAKPLEISFAGTNIDNDTALAAAQNAGYPVISVVSKSVVAEKGKTDIVFTTELPYGFTLEYFEALEPFND